MTGYYISLGYNPIKKFNDNEMWEELKKSARNVADNPDSIIAEARKLGSPETCERGCCELDYYADNYKNSFETDGHPITIIEKKEIGDCQIMQLASSDDPIKYHVRRAYIRLLIEDIHRKEIEVSLTVA